MSPTASWTLEEARSRCRDDLVAMAPEAGEALWGAESLFLVRSWTEPHRAYHGLRHVAEMLTALTELSAHEPGLSAHDILLASVATWYHDVRYDPRATPGSNEHHSATLARDHLHRLGVTDADMDTVQTLVLMTRTHDAPESAAPGVGRRLLDVFHDMDLWILSAPPQRYRDYARQVREEYAHVPEERFAAGRTHILQGFLERPRLYAHAQDGWEERARANLVAEIDRLS